MEYMADQDLSKLKELLRHTGEFIAYFELAESKMIEWRQDIEHQAQIQEQKVQQQLHKLHNELEALQEVLSQAGLARFRLTAETTLKQGEEHLAALQMAGVQLVHEISEKHNEFSRLTEKSLAQIEQYAAEALVKIDKQLMHYDVQHFRRVASESCEQVERVASHAVSKSSRLLHSFQWRSIALALTITLLTTFMIGLYLSNEFPWETHRQAQSEREAGKVLLKAWPSLSQEEKTKILNGRSEQDV